MTYQPAPWPPDMSYGAPTLKHTSILDLVVALVLAVVYGVVTAGILFFSLFAMMATDSCSDVRPCNYDAFSAAYVVLWGGSAAIALAMVVGVIWMSVKRRLMSWVPLSAIVLEIPVVLIAVALAQQLQ